MTVTLKSPQEIVLMREAGRLTAETYEVLREHVLPGVTTLDLDRLVEEFIRKKGARAIYKGYVPAGGRGSLPVMMSSIWSDSSVSHSSSAFVIFL